MTLHATEEPRTVPAVSRTPRAGRTFAIVGVGLLLSVIFFAGGLVTGERSAGTLEWRTASGYAGSKVLTVESDGWAYGVRRTVPMWWDEQGRLHEDGWPTCLPPGEQVRVRFAAVETTVDGITTRPIVAVDCR